MAEIHVPVVCMDCGWVEEWELTREPEAAAVPRTIVAWLPVHDGNCTKCGKPTVIPAARYESTEDGTLAFELDSGPPMTLGEIKRRRALLESVEEDWTEVRKRAHLGVRLPVLEDAQSRHISKDERQQLKRRFAPEDGAHDIAVISRSTSVDHRTIPTLPSVLDLLDVVKQVGIERLREAEDPRSEDTWIAGAVARARLLARRRLAICEDHLESLAATIRSRRASTSFAIARGCGEIAGQALWLLAPDDSVDVAARYNIDRWNGMYALSQLKPEHAEALRQQAAGEAAGLVAEANEWEIGWHNDWPRQIGGQGKPGLIDTMKNVFPKREMGEEAVRTLSALVHGSEYGLQDLMTTLDGREVMAVKGAQLSTVIRLAVWPYGVALRRYAVVIGLDSSPPSKHIDAILELLRSYDMERREDQEAS